MTPLAALLADVAAERGMTTALLIGPKRYPHLVAARRAFAHAARAEGYSYPAIGRALGRDHSSIMSLVKTTGWVERTERVRVRVAE